MPVTRYGAEVRTIRRVRKQKLFEMANLLDVTPSFLSALETGRRPVPAGFVNKIITALQLGEVEARRIRRAVEQDAKEVRVDHMSPEGRELIAAFARSANSMTSSDLNKLKELFRVEAD